VSLYKVGSFYFVLDGHHRLSVASYHGVEWIDAEVTEFGARPSKARGQADEQRERGEAKMYQWLPPQLLKDIHEQAVRDAQQAARKLRVGRASDLTWELKRHAGRFRKRLKTLWNVD
jgi:hypothetical protein